MIALERYVRFQIDPVLPKGLDRCRANRHTSKTMRLAFTNDTGVRANAALVKKGFVRYLSFVFLSLFHVRGGSEH